MTIWVNKPNLELELSTIFELDSDILIEREEVGEDRIKYTATLQHTSVDLDAGKANELYRFLNSIRDGNPEMSLSNDSIQDFIKISLEVDENVVDEE